MNAYVVIQSVVEMSTTMNRPAFRGQAKDEWRLDSAAVRRLEREYGDDVLTDERVLHDLLRRYQADERIIPMGVIGGYPMEELQALSVLQHHGAATMLLDFTENALVALWFASTTEDDHDGRVFAVDIGDPSTWTNGRKLEHVVGNDEDLIYYEPDRSLGARIVAQQSVFLVCNPRIPERVVKTVKVPSDSKREVRKTLERLGISERALFGDVSGLAALNAWERPLRMTLAGTAEEHRKQGNSAYQEGQFRIALTAYKMYAAEAPDAAEPHLLIGNALAALGRHRAAVGAYDQAMNVDGEQGLDAEKRGMLHYNRGNSHAALDEHEAAVVDFDKAMECEPSRMRDARFNRGNSRYALRRFEKACGDYRDAGGLTRSQTALNIGNCQLILGRFTDALKSYRAGSSANSGAAAGHCRENSVQLERVLVALGNGGYTTRVQNNDLMVETDHSVGSFGFAGNSGNQGNRWGGRGYKGAVGFAVIMAQPSPGRQ